MELTRNEIVQKLNEIVDMALGEIAVTADESSNLTTDLGLNSVGLLYVVIAIEEFFGVRFDDVSFGDFQTVGDVVDYIEKKLKA
ncbi:MAG: acyl carrier protein [Clostridia bacterium]|nr:acyl carrier protein [Clostridia bacterium]